MRIVFSLFCHRCFQATELAHFSRIGIGWIVTVKMDETFFSCSHCSADFSYLSIQVKLVDE